MLFQYLKSQVKFKTDLQFLDLAQSKTVDEMQTKVYRLLGETLPNWPDFTKSVMRMLGREEAWNKWKNDGCPRYAHLHDDVLPHCVPHLGQEDGGDGRNRS